MNTLTKVESGWYECRREDGILVSVTGNNKNWRVEYLKDKEPGSQSRIAVKKYNSYKKAKRAALKNTPYLRYIKISLAA